MKSIKECSTEHALDEFLRQEFRLRALKPHRKQKFVQQSPEASPTGTQSAHPIETSPALLQVLSPDPLPKVYLDLSLDRGKYVYRKRKPVLPNFKSLPFGAHNTYNSYRNIREQFLYEWDDWDRKCALRIRRPKPRRPQRVPVVKELPAITEHKVTARLALKNFYLLKKRGFSQIARDLNKSESMS